MQAGSYRLAPYAASDRWPRGAIVVDDRVVDATSALRGSSPVAPVESISVLSILQDWKETHPRLKQAAVGVRNGDSSLQTLALSSTELLAPVLYPGTIFCAGANYKDHVAEMSKALNLPAEADPHELGLKPWHFIKPSAPCVRATNTQIPLPAYSKRVDWEAEIAVVIGSECRNVDIDDALEHVAGLSIVNDLSARDHLRRNAVPIDSPFRYDWISQKAFDGALPFGPWICPIDEIEDLGNLGIKLWVNDELMQDSSSANLIFSVAEQISHLSTRLTLRPGDVIATGTPAGCGAARGRFLQPGDRVRIWVEHVGTLVNDFS